MGGGGGRGGEGRTGERAREASVRLINCGLSFPLWRMERQTWDPYLKADVEKMEPVSRFGPTVRRYI